MAIYDDEGREVPDPTPVEMPVGFEHPESLESMIARMVRVESVLADRQGFDSLEESDDFGEDEDLSLSGYQLLEMKAEEVAYARERSQGKVAKSDGDTGESGSSVRAGEQVSPGIGKEGSVSGSKGRGTRRSDVQRDKREAEFVGEGDVGQE